MPGSAALALSRLGWVGHAQANPPQREGPPSSGQCDVDRKVTGLTHAESERLRFFACFGIRDSTQRLWDVRWPRLGTRLPAWGTDGGDQWYSMTRLDQERRPEGRRSLNLSSNQVIAALILGLCTIVAAFVTGAVKGQTLGLRATPTVTVTKRIIVTVTASPRRPSNTSHKSNPRPNPTGSTIPILTPKNQPGWSQVWNGSENIGPQGIILAQTGSQVGNGSNFNIQYVPGNGWGVGGSWGDFGYWDNTYRPGPAIITGIVQAGADHTDPRGQLAQAGDRLFYQSNDGTIVSYMQVTRVAAGVVVTDMWLWVKS